VQNILSLRAERAANLSSHSALHKMFLAELFFDESILLLSLLLKYRRLAD